MGLAYPLAYWYSIRGNCLQPGPGNSQEEGYGPRDQVY